MKSVGSSPRMWGTPYRYAWQWENPRFIPTHVGNTLAFWPTPAGDAVHPHACGEHAITAAPASASNGSSPRMWGTPICGHHQRRPARFIPTHVGNTARSPLGEDTGAVHPHACGEHPLKNRMSALSVGSSPRMWGTLLGQDDVCYGNRFIPTHVGNTQGWEAGRHIKTVHPHACGEHNLVDLGAGNDLRFIPTHVGNTSVSDNPIL